MDNQQPSPDEGKAQRLSRKRVHIQAIGIWKQWTPNEDEDIVYSLLKESGCKKRQQGVASFFIFSTELIKMIGWIIYVRIGSVLLRIHAR